MWKQILKRIFSIVSYPIRLAFRAELMRTTHRQDLAPVMYRRATESSADYVIKHMPHVDSVTSSLDLLTMAMGKADSPDKKLICEFGVYSGSTINHLASLKSQPIYGFDSFEGLPEQWRDGIGKGYFKVASLPTVRSNVTLVKGWFNETLPTFLKEHPEPVGFIHIDCDLYSSTKTVFELLAPRIQPGCVIVFDEYFNYPGWEVGEYKAFQEFIKAAGLAYEYIGYNRLYEQVAVKIKAP